MSTGYEHRYEDPIRVRRDGLDEIDADPILGPLRAGHVIVSCAGRGPDDEAPRCGASVYGGEHHCTACAAMLRRAREAEERARAARLRGDC